MTLVEALRSWNYEAVEAVTVAEATRVFSEEEPSIVLLDIDLPDGSGLDVLNEIKRENPETIVIMITGNVSVPTIQNPRPERTPKASLNEENY